MTDKDGTTQGATFDVASCMAMMSRMMEQRIKGCDCAEMMSRWTSKDAIPEMQDIMRQMASCCGTGTKDAPASQ